MVDKHVWCVSTPERTDEVTADAVDVTPGGALVFRLGQMVIAAYAPAAWTQLEHRGMAPRSGVGY